MARSTAHQGIASAPIQIGTLNEGSLHAALKARYFRPGDDVEQPIDGFVVDICRPGLLIEIQTGSFRAMGPKLDHLLEGHRMLLVHPIAVETWWQRPGRRPRKSPRRGSIYDLFEELVSIPTLVDHPHLMLEVLLVSVVHRQRFDRRARRGRGRYVTVDRRLREVLAVRRFGSVADLAALLPPDLPPVFTTADLARAAGITRSLAQQMTFCLRLLEVVADVGRGRAGIRYERTARSSLVSTTPYPLEHPPASVVGWPEETRS